MGLAGNWSHAARPVTQVLTFNSTRPCLCVAAKRDAPGAFRLDDRADRDRRDA